jgi:hypothetical protein
LFASSLRVLAEKLPAVILLAQVAVLFAFISGTARVIEDMQGRTELPRMNFSQTWSLSRIILKIFGAGFLLCLLAYVVAGKKDGSLGLIHYYIVAFDCLAFDSFFTLNKITSAAVGLFAFFIVVNAGTGKPPSIAGVLSELSERAKFMFKALLIVIAYMLILGELQGLMRPFVLEYVRAHGANNFMSKTVFYVFVVGFAYLRLTVIIAIYSYWLKKSYLTPPDKP